MSKTRKSPVTTSRPFHQAPYWIAMGVMLISAGVIAGAVNVWSARHFKRFDWTSDASYSLSPQTTAVLTGLKDPMRITALYSQIEAGHGKERTQEQAQAVADLLAEYARLSGGKISIKVINPAKAPDEYAAFARDLQERHKDELKPHRMALDAMYQLLNTLQEYAKEGAKRYGSLPMTKTVDGQPSFSWALSQYMTRVQNQVAQHTQRLNQFVPPAAQTPSPESALSAGMADYDRATNLALRMVQENWLADLDAILGILEQIVSDTKHDTGLRGMAAIDIEGLSKLKVQASAVAQMLAPLKPTEYGAMQGAIRTGQYIVIEAGKQQVALGYDEVYQPVSRPGEPQRMRFVGEQSITSAIAGLTLEKKPRIVLVSDLNENLMKWLEISKKDFLASPNKSLTSYFRAALGPLAAKGFEIIEWYPIPMDPKKPQETVPFPQAAPGQTMVLIVLPTTSAASKELGSEGFTLDAGALRLSEEVKKHIKAGGPALFLALPDQSATVGYTYNFGLEQIKPFGVGYGLDRIVISKPEESPTPILATEIRDWPQDDNLIVKSVRGLNGVALYATPLSILENKPQDVTTWPLIMTPPEAWDISMRNAPKFQELKPPPAGQNRPLLLGVAASKGRQRVAAMGMHWAFNDFCVVNAKTEDGALFRLSPANAELFDNTLYWLAGLDQLVSATPAAQDTPRVGEVTKEAMTSMYLLLLIVLPTLCLVSGVGVWLGRRR